MNYATIQNGIVTNILWLHPANAQDFPSAVPTGDYPVRKGDAYADGSFFRDGVALKTQAQLMAEEMQDAQDALALLGVNDDV